MMVNIKRVLSVNIFSMSKYLASIYFVRFCKWGNVMIDRLDFDSCKAQFQGEKNTHEQVKLTQLYFTL